MSLTSRITLTGTNEDEPEDLLSSALGVIYPDDVTNQHGDADHPLLYTSPHLPGPPLGFDLMDPDAERERMLFSHYMWNASLLMGELVERDTLGLEGEGEAGPGFGPGMSEGVSGVGVGIVDGTTAGGARDPNEAGTRTFDVRGKSIVELGAGTALPSIMAAILGASRVLVTDYPSQPVLEMLRGNVRRNTEGRTGIAIEGTTTSMPVIEVEGHEWGVFERSEEEEESKDGEGREDQENESERGEDQKLEKKRNKFDRVIACDCLWMPWQHENLRKSIGHFLAPGPESRAWVIAGFHTGRAKMAGFFETEALRRDAGLEVEHIWERECDGKEREWDPEGEEEDPGMRKRWLVVGILKNATGSSQNHSI
ncbi:putative methyltransferase [Geosmithia morbida]|uniref:Methyltransferase n=1 Tax=Geosmithia morbida TaxID=1094350 RepID=A0A9P5D0N2_9HYPO|nr:putative methyltransferase [Geosmithia morbida]KAF4121802.1 putative methyltransferase [Geosmithia morbida]